MKKLTIIKWVGIILAVVVIVPYLINYAVSVPYYSDVETAVKNKSSSKNHIKIATIEGKEGLVHISLCDYNTISAYSFHIKTANGNTLYKVAKETGLSYVENSMVKMNTSPSSTEQIVFGIGEALANDCVEKTGINTEFVHFKDAESQYAVWYIISASGLDELPALQLNNGVWEHFPSAHNYIALLIPVGLIIIVAVSIYWKKKKKA